jgi:hypothetical protein
MKVRVTESFNTAKGNIPEGTIIDIPEAMFNRLKGKVTRIPPAADNTSFPARNIKPAIKHPATEGRCKTLGVVADAILKQAVIDIDRGSIWQSGPDIEILEDEINRLYRLLVDGLSTLAAFKEIVRQWQATGTQITKH